MHSSTYLERSLDHALPWQQPRQRQQHPTTTATTEQQHEHHSERSETARFLHRRLAKRIVFNRSQVSHIKFYFSSMSLTSTRSGNKMETMNENTSIPRHVFEDISNLPVRNCSQNLNNVGNLSARANIKNTILKKILLFVNEIFK